MDREQLKALLHAGGFAALGHENTDAVYAYDLDFAFIDANDEVFSRLGYTRAEMEAMPFGTVISAADRETALAHLATAASGVISSWTSSARSRSGRDIRVSVVNSPFYVDGEIVAVVGVVRDLEQLELSRRKADDLEVQLELMLDAMPDSVLLVNRDWTIQFANRAAREIAEGHGRTLAGINLWQAFDVSDESAPDFRAVMAGAPSRTHRGYKELVGLWFEVTVFATSQGIAIFSRDVDAVERARIERESNEKRAVTQSALLDAASDAMVVRQLDGTIAYWNHAAATLYGWTEAEALGASARDLLFDDPAEFTTAFDSTLQNGAWQGTVHQHSKEGAQLTVDTRWTLIRNSRGEPESVFSVSSDVTEQRRAETNQLRAQRLESLGTLAGGIAHDLNNVLTPILMSTQLLAELQTDGESRSLLEGVERSARRGASLIEQVLTFASGESGPLAPVELGSLLRDLERFCRETLPRTIDLDFAVATPDVFVLGNSTQLTQVLINVAVNARDAMPEGGHLRVRLDQTAGAAVITIADTGSGMDARTLDSIFEPFFTTKARGAGTGLGLATSLSIVKQHGGTMTASSTPGAGTTFHIELPVVAASAHDDDSPAAAAAPSSVEAAGGELVLVVDDEPSIRSITCRVLEAAGFRTIAAENGLRGVQAYRDQAEQVRMVLTDMNMPVMGGQEMGHQLRSAGYTGPILATSGAMRPDAGELAATSMTFIAKPYTTSELVAAVTALLGSDPTY